MRQKLLSRKLLLVPAILIGLSYAGYAAVKLSTHVEAAGTTANLWVDTNGGSCQRSATAIAWNNATACPSFDAAYQAASPGDIILVKAGSYPSQEINVKASAVAPNVVIAEATGERVIVGTSGETNNCVGFEGSSYVEVHDVETIYTYASDGNPHQCGIGIGRGGAHHVVLNGVDAGHVWVGADDIQVLNSDLGPGVSGHASGLTATAISTSDGDTNEPAKRVLFEGNTIHSVHRIGTSHPQCSAPWAGQDITFRNNTFNNCAVFHFWMSAPDDAEGAFATGPYLIEGNTFTQTDQVSGKFTCSGQQIKFGDHGGEIVNTVFRNNHILTDCIGIHAELGNGGGFGNITIEDNELGRSLSINGTSCMGADTVVTQGGATYSCGGNYMTGFPSLASPLYRLYAPAANYHFWTANPAERDWLVNVRKDFILEGTAGKISSSSGQGLILLYRLYAPSANKHFWTTSSAERDWLSITRGDFVYEGTVGYVSQNGTSGLTPLYRLYAPSANKHFWTNSSAEKDWLAITRGDFNVEGTIGFMGQ